MTWSLIPYWTSNRDEDWDEAWGDSHDASLDEEDEDDDELTVSDEKIKDTAFRAREQEELLGLFSQRGKDRLASPASAGHRHFSRLMIKC